MNRPCPVCVFPSKPGVCGGFIRSSIIITTLVNEMNCTLVESGKGPFLPSLNLSFLLVTQFEIGCHLILHCR